MRSVGGITIGERIAAAFFGAVFGALIGLILVWLFGVYSQSMGPGRFVPDAVRWVAASSGFFALIGLIVGSHVGTALGWALSAIFEAERERNDFEVPTWLAIALVVAVAYGVYLWVSN